MVLKHTCSTVPTSVGHLAVCIVKMLLLCACQVGVGIGVGVLEEMCINELAWQIRAAALVKFLSNTRKLLLCIIIMASCNNRTGEYMYSS